MKITEDASKHKFSADRPIISGKDDLLGITDFAESLASAIKGWKGKNSLVIALYGTWGSGKTSVKNVAIEALKKDDKNCPLMVEFNPWHWAGQEQLIETFFNEIGSILGKADKTKGKKRAAKWKQYSTYLTIGTSITKSAKTLLPLLGVLGAGFLDIVSNKMEETSKLIKDSSEALAMQEENLNEMKNDLSSMMKTLKKPILVIIDDIDRLSSTEIRLFFQLIKANADFPNLIYLLLFQRDIVEKSLEDISPISGGDFLEKIVQIGFDIPKIQRSRLNKILTESLRELLSDKSINKRYDEHRWDNIFIGGLQPFFDTLRDVHRFLSMLSFQVSLFRNKESFEVNPIDLIALETLRTFEPKVYHGLFDIKYILTRQGDSDSKSAEDNAHNAVEAVINQSSESKRTAVREILKQLFPYIFSMGRYDSGFEEKWFRDLRVCHPNVFDRYFHFTIPEGDISQAEIDSILDSAGNREKLVSIFHSFNQRGILDVVLERLEAYKEHLDLKYAVPFITAIFDIGDDLPERQPGFYTISPDSHASRIVRWYLMKETDINKRGQILKEAMHATNGVYLPVSQTSWGEYSYEKPEATVSPLVSLETANELKGICINKIKDASKSDILRKNPHMFSVLYHWRKWSSPEESQKWVNELVQSREGLLSFLTGCLSSSASHSIGDYVERIRWRISLKNVEDFISPDIIAEKLSSLRIDELTEREQKAVRTFQKALKRRQEDKSDDDWRDDEE